MNPSATKERAHLDATGEDGSPRVSVIIPAYNAAAFLPSTLESVLRQTYSNWEVVLVDDGSTDHTREIVQHHMPFFGGRLNYIYQENRGLPAARNTAMRHARGEFIAILDADDVWLERRLELGVTVMDQNPDVGLVHGRLERINVQGKFVEYPPMVPRRRVIGKIARKIYTRKVHLRCPTILFRKACVAKVGGFDETMRATEDRDMWFRIAQQYEIGYVDEVIAKYRISPNSMSRDLNRMTTWQTYFVEKYRASPEINFLAVRQAMAEIYRERADALFKAGDVPQSLGWYWRSLVWYPFKPINVYMFFRALTEPLRLRLVAFNERQQH